MVTICQLYSDIMSTYGDRGNVSYLNYLFNLHGVESQIEYHRYGQSIPKATIYIFGGGQDKAQALVSLDLQGASGQDLNGYLGSSYCLAVCGGYQLLGQYYKDSRGHVLLGLGLLPTITIAGQRRLLGHVIAKRQFGQRSRTLVGFENHSGQTYLLDGVEPLAKIIRGNGNNGQDKTEGIVYKKIIGTYLHGPILPRNPHLAFWWLREIFESGNRRKMQFFSERKAHRAILRNT